MKSRTKDEGKGAFHELKAKAKRGVGKDMNNLPMEGSKLYRKMATPAVLFRFSVKW